MTINKNQTLENFKLTNKNAYLYNNVLFILKHIGNYEYSFCIYGLEKGKTHLLNAIGNYILKNTNLKILYTSCINLNIDNLKDLNVLLLDDAEQISEEELRDIIIYLKKKKIQFIFILNTEKLSENLQKQLQGFNYLCANTE